MDGIPGPGEGWDAKKMLDFYIYDYLKKNNMPQAAEIFARETNILDDLPSADEGFLTDWWSIFWDMYSAESPSSSVQVDSALQSIRQETPVVIHQPAPLGVDLSSTMMTGQQPAGQLLAANNYQLGDLPLSPPLFELNPQLQVHARQVQAQAQADRQAWVQTIPRAQTIARARTQQEELRAQLQEMAQLQEIASSNNISYKELLALRMGALTQPQVPPSLDNALQSIRQETPVVIHQLAPLGVDLDSTMMTRQQPAVGHLLTANNNRLGDLTLSPAHCDLNSLLEVSASQAQALANRQAQVRRAELIAEVEGMASSSNDSYEELLALRMGAQTQQQVPPSGINHGVIDQPAPLGADVDSTMMRKQQPAVGNLLTANNNQLGDLGLSPAQVQAQAEANRKARLRAFARAHAPLRARARQAELRAQLQESAQLEEMASSSNASSQELLALRMGALSQQQVPPRGNDGASPGANQQRTEADEGKEMGSGSNR